MKRKVAKIGPSTLMVSLPNKWARKFGVSKGDEVEVEEDGDSLIINLGKLKSGKSKTLNVHDLDVMLNRVVGASYKKGYDEVLINFNSSEQLKSIYDVINTMWTGFEVVEQEKGHIKMKQITEVNKNDFAGMINRAMLFLISTADESRKAAEDENKEHLKAVVLRDQTQNKYCDFCRRVLNKTDIENSNAIYYIVEQVEKIGDFYRDLSRYLVENKVSKDTVRLLAEINYNLQNFYSLYHKFDLKSFEDFGRKFKSTNKKIKDASLKADKNSSVALNYLSIINGAVFDMNGALLVMHLEHI